MKKQLYYVTRMEDEDVDVIYIGHSKKKALEICEEYDNPVEGVYCDWGVYSGPRDDED